MIELTVYGDPAACRAAAGEGRRVASALSASLTRLRGAEADGWVGEAADAYRAGLSKVGHGVSDLSERIEPACRALEDFAGELDVVVAAMAGTRAHAQGAGLTVTADAVQPPAPATGPLSLAVRDEHEARVSAWNECVSRAEAARTKEREAHTRLGAAMAATNGDGWLENLLETLGLAPPDGMDGVTGAGYLLGLGGLGFGGLAGWMSHGVLGMWQPKFLNPSGSWVFGTNQGWSTLDRLRLSLRPGAASRDWRALPYQAGNLQRWEAAGRWANRAGGAVTALTTGWSQWQADADDPSLDTGERVDRAVTTGASSAAGALAGAQGGAWAGGAIGTAICPGVGTVVGGAVGGLVGGAVGAYAGSELADVVNEQWDGAAHAVGDALGAAGDGLSDVGDTLTFWD